MDVQPDTSIPIDSEKIWRAAIFMMFSVTDYPLERTWLGRSFPSPLGDTEIRLQTNSVGKDPSHLTTQHIIWGLNRLMLSMKLSKEYCQTEAKIEFEGVLIGAIVVAHQKSWKSAPDTKDDKPASIALNRAESRLSHFFDRDVNVGVAYGDKEIDKDLIYLTAIKAMGNAAENGLDTPVPFVVTTGIQRVTWKLLRIRSVGSQVPDFKAGHSRMAVYRTLSKLIYDQKFMEIYVVLDIVGTKCALGGFDQGSSNVATS